MRCLFAIGLLLGLCGAAFAASPSHCAVCTVHWNDGGIVKDFQAEGSAIHRHGMLVIDGFCGSACMVMADRARPHACVTANATFGFHQTNYGRPIPLSSDLRAWTTAHGGFPASGGHANIMPNEAARQFWALCG
jgi:hypothetical protein